MRRVALVAVVVLGVLGLEPSTALGQVPRPEPAPEVPGRPPTELPALSVSGTEPAPVWVEQPAPLSAEEQAQAEMYGHVLSDAERDELIEANQPPVMPELPAGPRGYVEGRSVELVDERFEFGSVYENPDGTRSSQVSTVPMNYQLDGRWVPIDTTLVQDPADPTRVRSAANVWSVSFGATAADAVVLTTPEGEVSWVPDAPEARASVAQVDGDSVVYRDVWPGVDVRYVVESWGVKEEVVINRPGQSAFEFTFSGAELVPDEDTPGGYRLTGPVGERMRIAAPLVLDVDGAPVPAEVAAPVIDAASAGSADDAVGSRVSMSVSAEYLARLAPDEFPVVLDPGPYGYVSNSQESFVWINGVGCANYCSMIHVGNNPFNGVDYWWRTLSHFSYEPLMTALAQAPNPYTIEQAVIAMDQNLGGGGAVQVRWASAWNWDGEANPPVYPYYDSGGHVEVDVTDTVDSWFTTNTPGGSFHFRAQVEVSGVNSFRRFDNEALWITWNQLPATPVQAGSVPTNGAQPHYHTTAVDYANTTDPEGDTVYYRHFVCTTNTVDCQGAARIWDSEWSLDSGSCMLFGDWCFPGGPPPYYNQTLYWGVETTDSYHVADCECWTEYRFPNWLNSFTLTNSAPPAPTATGSAPVDGFVIVNENQIPTLSVNTVVDADGDMPMYQFEIRESGGVGSLATSWQQPSLPAPPTISWTPPPGLGLVPGRTYTWTVRAWDWVNGVVNQPPINQMTPRGVRFDQRLGTSSPAPMQSAGAVSVNLATGNVVAGASTPSLPTTAGSLGYSFSYNSLDRTNQGLTGSYWNDVNQNGVIDTAGPDVLALRRTDPAIAFDWGYGSPSPSVPVDQFMARWTGWVQVPSTGAWQIAVANDDWVEVTVNGVTGLVGCCNSNRTQPTPAITTGTLTAGSWYPIQVTMREWSATSYLTLLARPQGSNGAYQQMTADWFRTSAPVLPQGWTFSGAAASGAPWVRAAVSDTSVVLTAPDGRTVTYPRAVGLDPSRGYVPPAGEDDVVSVDTATGTVSVQGTDGTVTAFDSKGTLVSVTNPLDTRSPAAHQLVYTSYSGDATRLTSVTDPVSNRSAVLRYQGVSGFACPAVGYETPPDGMLCEIELRDVNGAWVYRTNLYYLNGQISRVVSTAPTGGSDVSVTDFGYAGGVVNQVRDPFAAEVVAALAAGGNFPNDVTTRTVVTYSGARATQVEQPIPEVGAARPSIDIAYVSSTATEVNVAGLGAGYERRVTFDAQYRLLTDTDATGAVTSREWDGADRLLSSTSAGRTTTTHYDTRGRVTDTYGPANTSCFNTTTRVPNGTCTSPPVPHTSTTYDGGIGGLSASWFPNKTLFGAPAVFETTGGALYSPGQALVYNAENSAPPTIPTDNYSGRFTGEILMPTVGTYQFRMWAEDGARLWIDDQYIVGDWNDGGGITPMGSFVNTQANSWHRIRVEFYDATGFAQIYLYWTPPGGTEAWVPATSTTPRYGLVTSTTTDDSSGAPSMTTSTAYNGGIDPIYGLPTSTTTGGLTTSTGYESLGTGHYLRRVSRTLPGGNQTTYAYYGTDANPATANTSCTGNVAVNQGRGVWKATSPAPLSGTAITYETTYDTAGRVTGTRTMPDTNWSCTTYDARGRVATRTIPAYGGSPARTITYNYAVGGNPRVTSVTDGSVAGSPNGGTITTTVDLLGRVISYTDVWGLTTTTTYDQAGRAVQSVSPGGTVDTTYDQAGRVDQVRHNNLLVADVTYTTGANGGEVASISYPSGAGSGGNGTSSDPLVRNSNGQLTSLAWRAPGGALITSSGVTRSQSGRIVDETIDGTDPYTGGTNYTYDTAGRLTQARLPSGVLDTYGYGAPTGCAGGTATNPGANTNRTSWTSNGAAQATYCYDNADRLVSVAGQAAGPYSGTIGYDSHGNTTTLAGQTLTYDAANRHMGTSVGTPTTSSVTYTRDVLDRIVARTATGAPLAITARAASNASNQGTQLAIPTPAGVVAGDVMVAQVSTRGTPAITPPAGWTQAATQSNATTSRTTVWWRVATANEPVSSTFTWTGAQNAAGGIVAYTGVNTTTPIDVTATSTGASSTTHTAPSVTTTGTNRMVVAVYGVARGTTSTPGAGLTERVDANKGNATGITAVIDDRPVAAAGATGTSTMTTAAASTNAAITIALRPDTTTPVNETYRYSHSASGDTPSLVLNTSNTVVQMTMALPGGVVWTSGGGSQTWSYPNIHGDVAATANAAGVKQGATFTYDPWGNPTGGALPDNAAGNLDWASLGQHQRPLEHTQGIQPLIEMGARGYEPNLGRFLEVDPVEGGCSNIYAYVDDPINSSDLTGLFDCISLGRKIRRLTEELRNRFTDIRENALNLPISGPFSIEGHRQQFRNKQKHTRGLLQQWDDEGCGPDGGGGTIPVRAWSWATAPAPYPIGWESRNNNPSSNGIRVQLPGGIEFTWHPVLS